MDGDNIVQPSSVIVLHNGSPAVPFQRPLCFLFSSVSLNIPMFENSSQEYTVQIVPEEFNHAVIFLPVLIPRIC